METHLNLYNLPVQGPSKRPLATPMLGKFASVQKTTQPQFSGVGRAVSRGLEPLFRSTQEYVWELLLLDVVALWIPRIWNALDRGRVGVSLNQIVMDPKHQDKSSVSQFGTWMKKNVKGFNWPNGLEETWREIQSAPMLLVVQSMFFGIAMEHDVAKKGILLAKNDLEPMNKAFAQFVSSKSSSVDALLHKKGGLHQLTSDFYSHVLGKHFERLGSERIDLRNLRENITPKAVNWLDSTSLNKGKGLPPSNRYYAMQWLEKEFSKTPELMTYENAIARWTSQLTTKIARNEKYAKLYRLGRVLKGLSSTYNESILRFHPDLPVSEIRLGIPSVDGRRVSDVIELFDKYYDLLRGAGRLTKTASKGASVGAKQPLSQILLKTMGTLEKALMGRKMLYGFAVTGITMISYFASSMHAQSNNAYPANRLYHHEGHDGEGKPTQVDAQGTKLSTTLETALKSHKLKHSANNSQERPQL